LKWYLDRYECGNPGMTAPAGRGSKKQLRIGDATCGSGPLHFYRRRPRIINRAPQSSAMALAPDAESISGAATAEATLDTPIQRSDSPAIFIIKFFILSPLKVNLYEYQHSVMANQWVMLLVREPLEGSGNLVGEETGVFLEGKGEESIGGVLERSNHGSLSTHVFFHGAYQSNLFAKLATY